MCLVNSRSRKKVKVSRPGEAHMKHNENLMFYSREARRLLEVEIKKAVAGSHLTLKYRSTEQRLICQSFSAMGRRLYF